jgi:hypothetical protein
MYPHPLHSFLFIPRTPDLTGPPAPHELVLQSGVLRVRPGLVRWAREVTTPACTHTIGTILDAHQPFADTLEPYGLGRMWAGSIGYWAGQLVDLEARRQDLAARILLQNGLRKRSRDGAKRMWQRLNLASRLAEVVPPLAQGRPPRAEADLVAALQLAVERLDQPELAKRAACNGFGPGERAFLVECLGELVMMGAQVRRMEVERSEAAGRVLVVRGALLGDMARLNSLAYGIGLPEDWARRLDVRLVLGSPRRRRLREELTTRGPGPG